MGSPHGTASSRARDEQVALEEGVIWAIHNATSVRAGLRRFRPIFVEEPERLVVVTLYVYFNQRAEP